MATRAGKRLGCLAMLTAIVVAVVWFFRWWTAPIDIPRPQRPPEPAGNAYEVYRSLAAYTAQIFQTDPWMTFAERRIFSSRGRVSLEDPEWVRYLRQKVQPVRQEYRRFLHKPCMAILEYTPHWTFSELAEFRRWAGWEALDIALALREKDYSRAVDDYRTILLLSEQIRCGGGNLHYFTSMAMQSVVTRQMSEVLPQLPAEMCNRLVKVVREWESKRVPVTQALTTERGFYVSLLHDLYAGNLSPRRLGWENPALVRWNPRLFNLRRAAREGEAYFRRLQREWMKPVAHQADVASTNHPIGRLFLPALSGAPKVSAYTEARIRMLACAAGVRAYRLRHGFYPASLSEAGVADLARDPFTGGQIAYQTHADGFLLYSLGEDGDDDGGWRVSERALAGGDGDVAMEPYYGPPPTLSNSKVKGEPLRIR